jgi:hypothetical protein
MYKSWKQAYSDVVEGNINESYQTFMFKTKGDAASFVKKIGSKKTETWSEKGIHFVDVYNVKKGEIAKLAKAQMPFWEENLQEDGHEQSANVMNQLSHIKRNVEQLMAQVKPDLEYPQWWVNKLVKSADYLDSATDFLQNKIDQGKEK